MKISSSLRQELTEKFDDVDFEAFCQDNFPDVYAKFSRGLRKDEKISLLLDYCQRKRQTDSLISLLRVETSSVNSQINMISDDNSQDSKQVKVFINYASEDKPHVRKLYEMLKKESWLDPWLDDAKLLPGQDWEYEINKAIKQADAVIICVSNASLTKIGVVQAEIHKADEMQERRPHGYIYMVPVLLEKCQVPDNLTKYHWVDVFAPGKIDLVIRSLETIRTLKQ